MPLAWLPEPPVLMVLGGVYGVLAVATLLAGMLRLRRGEAARELWLRCVSWWWMITLTAAAILIGPPGVILFFSFVSYLALQEFLSIVPSRPEDRPIVLAAFAIIPVNAALIWFEVYGVFLIFIPVYAFVVFPFLLVLAGQVKRFLAFMGALHWGMMLTVYNIGYIAYLSVMPAADTGAMGAAGAAVLVLAILVLTEFNDVAQFVSGKMIGGPKIVPKVSPKKTWSGFLGGVLATGAAGAGLLPLLTPFSLPMGAAIGAGLAIAGFAGDVTMSAVKRDLGLKDTSALIPGHGGILDRIDSLTFTAPLFFHALVFFCYPGYA